MPKLRVVSYVVNVQAMADDGENLTPVETAPQVIPAAAWEDFVATGLPAALSELQDYINAAHDVEQ